MKPTHCIKCNKDLLLRDEDAGSITEETRTCVRCRFGATTQHEKDLELAREYLHGTVPDAEEDNYRFITSTAMLTGSGEEMFMDGLLVDYVSDLHKKGIIKFTARRE